MSTSGASGGVISSASVTIAKGAIGTLFSVPVTLVAAPGANRYINVLEIITEGVPTVGGWRTSNLAYTYQNNAGRSIGTAGLAMLLGDTPAHELDTTITAAFANVAPAEVVNLPVVASVDTHDPYPLGAITASTLASGGTGYAPGDTGLLDLDFFGPQAAYVVDTVGALGVVLTFHLTVAGTGYSTVDNPFNTTASGSQPGIGTGLQINVTAITAPAGNIYVTALYETITTH